MNSIQIYNNLITFFAQWFHDFKKHTFNVKVINESKDSVVIEKRLGNVATSLEILGKQIANSSNAQNITFLKSISLKLEDLLDTLATQKQLDVSKLERQVANLADATKKADRAIVSIANFPLNQKVSGEVSMKESERIIQGLQVVVDAINDMKAEMGQEMKNVSVVVGSGSGGSSSGSTQIVPFSSIGHGVKTVTTAGTDVVLASDTACKRVTLQAQTDNTGVIAVGASGVDATIITGTGILLNAGDYFEFDINNLASIYIDATVSGDGVRYTYFV